MSDQYMARLVACVVSKKQLNLLAKASVRKIYIENWLKFDTNILDIF